MTADLHLHLEFPAGTGLPLDECLIAVAVLGTTGPPVTVNARLNLVEGDLTVRAGDRRCAWPWPVDSGPREVRLTPDTPLTGAVPLLATDTGEPLFPAPGSYPVIAEFDALPGVRVRSDPVRVTRTPAGDPDRAAALRDRDVLRSLLSASALGAAADRLPALTDATAEATRVLARLALDRPPAATTADGRAALDAVLPPALAGDDPRRA